MIDIVVIGLGTMGSMALWQAAEADGQSVLGIEQFGPVHANGAYAGESRLFRVAAKEGQLYTPALLEARRMWKALGQASGRELLLETGALSVGPDDHPDLAATLTAMQDFDLPHDRLDAEELRSRFPQFAVEDNDIGVLDQLGGALRPEAAVLAATERAVKLGAQVSYNTEVTGIDVVDGGVRIHTSRGEVHAKRVIITAGPWTTRVLPELRDLVTVSTYALTWLMPRHIEMFTPDKLPGFMRDLGDLHAFGVPTLDGYSIKICPHLVFDEVADYAQRASTLSREQLRWVGAQAARLMPDLVPEPVRWSLHADSQTASKMPIIDTVADGLITVATGMSGNGFKFAPVYGRAVAELAMHGASEWRHPLFTVAAHRERLGAASATSTPTG
ncbi:N-methyl-L-tryptophan oxidase [Cryobacterium sp. PH29-G1]|nr:N-methyl-L-tryptophan oxidase [Cryobacterium sp. PH29-G1]